MQNTRKRGQRGRSKATLDLIRACLEIIEARYPITVRGVAYPLFVTYRLIDSMSKENTNKVSNHLTELREEGVIPWHYIVDESRTVEAEPGYANLEQYGRVIERAYRRDFWSDQKYRLIIVSEKATVSGLLRAIIEKYGVTWFPVHGFNSATKVNGFVEEIKADKRIYVFLYCGDWDPSGMWMSERDWFVTGTDHVFPRDTRKCNRLIRYGADPNRMKWQRIALVKEDLQSLPSFDAEEKKTDTRYKWFIRNYGNQAYEIDAMDPRILRERVESHILRYIDHDAWERHLVRRSSARVNPDGRRTTGLHEIDGVQALSRRHGATKT
jgi:hypothetical protein